MVGTDGRVDAVDPGDQARRRIERSLAASAVDNVAIHETTCERFVAGDEALSYDAALVDAPCSGLGTLREHPEIRWRRRRRDLERFAKKQSAILDAAASRVRPGGTLVYSTCTLASTENEGVVDAFLQRNDAWSRTDPPAGFPTALIDERGDLRTTPDRHDTDGFFAARLRRRNDAES